jgi:type II secretory pathway pseudopilin PulG
MATTGWPSSQGKTCRNAPAGWRNWLRRLTSDQAGFTLVEELVAIGLVGAGLVLVVVMIGTGTAGVTAQRDQVLAHSLARAQIELIKDATYQTDPGASPYPTVSVPAGYSLGINVAFWDEGSGTFVASPNGSGLQRVTVSVSRSGDLLATLQDLKADR